MSFFRRAGSSSESDSSSEEEELLSSSGSEDEEAPPQKQESKPMSRFLKTAGGDSSSSSESSDEEDSDDSDDDEAPKKSKFLKGAQSDDSDQEEDTKKIVKSAKDKRVEEMESIIKSLDNAHKISDWAAINTEFDKLTRLIIRLQTLHEPIPAMFIKTLVTLDDDLKSDKGDTKKKLNATNNRAMNGMRQKIKKSIRDWEKDVESYRVNPEEYESNAAAVSAAHAPGVAPTKPRAEKAEKAADENGLGFSTIGKAGKATDEPTITPETLFRHLSGILEARGKKNTDRSEQVRTLEKLLKVASTPYSKIRVLLALISSRFDYNATNQAHIPPPSWVLARAEFDSLVDLLISQPQYIVREETVEYEDSVERKPQGTDDVVQVRGSLVSFIERLDDEFTKTLQNSDPHSLEYVERLSAQKSLYQTTVKTQAYFELIKAELPISRTVMRRLEHIYSKPDAVVEVLEKSANQALGQLKSTITPLQSTFSSTKLVHQLCTYLYGASDGLLRTRAMLSHIYHHSLHNNFHTARDMFLMSHLQESISRADVATQILFNRTVVQLGLCAFRSGLIREARDSLREIFQSGRPKELLAQGVTQQRYMTMTPEQERAEKSRQVPFHMHINLELLEAAYLVSCMLIEIPKLASAAEDPDAKRKILSKAFKRQLDFAERQAFNGPPENTRDYIMQASKALQQSDWEKCRDLIHGIKIWSLMQGESQTKEMLTSKIQEEAMRTYLFANSSFYENISISILSSAMELDEKHVNSIISKMIWSEELSATIDQSNNVVVFSKVEPTRLQSLSNQLLDRANSLVELNEKAWQLKFDDGTNKSDDLSARIRRGNRGQGQQKGSRPQFSNQTRKVPV
ncbi:hypothetical protein E3P77_00016 [Wallemia ichthyophaga]|nr:hypothetical protein E3P78_00331 [Wallemia ichthyophaga]TIB70055.1 hypothetical protein E3P77_00016 [Wallemia ichthyophaga]